MKHANKTVRTDGTPDELVHLRPRFVQVYWTGCSERARNVGLSHTNCLLPTHLVTCWGSLLQPVRGGVPILGWGTTAAALHSTVRTLGRWWPAMSAPVQSSTSYMDGCIQPRIGSPVPSSSMPSSWSQRSEWESERERVRPRRIREDVERQASPAASRSVPRHLPPWTSLLMWIHVISLLKLALSTTVV